MGGVGWAPSYEQQPDIPSSVGSVIRSPQHTLIVGDMGGCCNIFRMMMSG